MMLLVSHCSNLLTISNLWIYKREISILQFDVITVSRQTHKAVRALEDQYEPVFFSGNSCLIKKKKEMCKTTPNNDPKWTVDYYL